MDKKWLAIFIISQAIALSQSFEVNCKYGVYSYGTMGVGLYTCDTTINIISSDFKVTSINGTHYTGRSNADVKNVIVRGNLNFVPRDFTKFFPNMMSYWFESTAIEKLKGDELNEFGLKLEWFLMFQSSLTTISSQLFEETPNVILVVLSLNQIKQVGKDLFSPLNVEKLQYASFSRNVCINQYGIKNQTEIQNVIDNLKVLCPYKNETCFDTETVDINQFVCDLRKTVKRLETDLAVKEERINNLENAIEFVRNELEALKSG